MKRYSHQKRKRVLGHLIRVPIAKDSCITVLGSLEHTVAVGCLAVGMKLPEIREAIRQVRDQRLGRA